jgi:cysteine sulfinate desulfinase/cysteine desulfurase-like protein
MTTTTIRKDQLEFLLNKIEHEYKHLITSHRGRWYSDDDRQAARRALAGTVSDAKQAVEGTSGATDDALLALRGRLMVQAELADGTLKDPSTLRR